MQYSTIPDIDKPVSRLVQGTMMMHPSRQEESFAILDACLAAGVNTFDTAHVYANGECETSARPLDQGARRTGSGRDPGQGGPPLAG